MLAAVFPRTARRPLLRRGHIVFSALPRYVEIWHTVVVRANRLFRQSSRWDLLSLARRSSLAWLLYKQCCNDWDCWVCSLRSTRLLLLDAAVIGVADAKFCLAIVAILDNPTIFLEVLPLAMVNSQNRHVWGCWRGTQYWQSVAWYVLAGSLLTSSLKIVWVWLMITLHYARKTDSYSGRLSGVFEES